jgi:putative autotransporter adhesin-like protein
MRPSLLRITRSCWLLLVLPFILTSCDDFAGKRVHGNGNIKNDDRSVTDFKKLDLHIAGDVFLTQGDHPNVKIETDDNLLQYIEVSQEGDKVTVRERPGFNLVSSNELKIYVTAPTFSRINASGACNIESQNKISNSDGFELNMSGAGNIHVEVDAPRVEAKLSGAGNIYLKGQTKDAVLNLTGAGNAHCYDLMAENTDVNISGFGNAEVYASVKLEASVSGAGDVHYKGNATNVEKHVSGAGSVNKAD